MTTDHWLYARSSDNRCSVYNSNMKQRLLAIALNSILMNLCLPYWISQRISCALESGHPVNIVFSIPAVYDVLLTQHIAGRAGLH